MRIKVEAWRRARDADETEKVTGMLTFVALDKTGVRAPCPLAD